MTPVDAADERCLAEGPSVHCSVALSGTRFCSPFTGSAGPVNCAEVGFPLEGEEAEGSYWLTGIVHLIGKTIAQFSSRIKMCDSAVPFHTSASTQDGANSVRGG